MKIQGKSKKLRLQGVGMHRFGRQWMGKVMEAPNTKTMPMEHDIHVGGWEKRKIHPEGHSSRVRKKGSDKGTISPQSRIKHPIRVCYSCLGVGRRKVCCRT